MKTVVLPNGKEVVLNRLPDSNFMRLRQAKTINSKKKVNNRQTAKRIIDEQLEEFQDEIRDLNESMEDYE